MTNDKDNDDNVIDIFSKQSPEINPRTSSLMRMSDDIDAVLNGYLQAGMSPDMVAAVVANRLGTLLSAMRDAGLDDPVEVYTQIVVDTFEKNDE